MNILTLLEYNTQITLNKWKDKLEPQVDREGKSADRIVDELERMDPTKNKQYMMWLLRQFTANRFRLEDADRVRTALSNFGKIKHKLPTEQRDIGRLNLHDLEDIVDKVFNPELGDKQDAGSGRSIPEDAEVLYNGPLGLLVIPKTEEASCELGKGTKWCTAAADEQQNMFNYYSERGPLYIWIDKNGDKYQFHFESRQFMDARDRKLDKSKFDYFRQEHPVIKKLFSRYEHSILDDPEECYEYAAKVLDDRFELGEKTIARDAHWASRYANDVLGGPFIAAEKTIAKDLYSALYYAVRVLKDRFELAEPLIAQHATAAFDYALLVIRGRFELGEDAIKTNGYVAYRYAYEVINGPFPEGEDAIAKTIYAAEYAINVLRRRFPEGEQAIKQLGRKRQEYNELFGTRL